MHHREEILYIVLHVYVTLRGFSADRLDSTREMGKRLGRQIANVIRILRATARLFFVSIDSGQFGSRRLLRRPIAERNVTKPRITIADYLTLLR